MKILHLNTFDTFGGASRAVFRLHQGLIDIGIDSHVFVQSKQSDHENISGPETKFQKSASIIRPYIESLPLRLYPERSSLLHLQWLPHGINTQLKKYNPDIVHLHWICDGFVSVGAVRKITVPIVWTLHDMWPFTGGCHYTDICERFMGQCGACPQLGKKSEIDLSRWTWRRKKNAWGDSKISFVAPSRWIADSARSSSLLKKAHIEVIPNGLNIQKFKRINQRTAREILGLPVDIKLILFGAIGATQDHRKGLHYLVEVTRAIRDICQRRTELLIFGEPKVHYRKTDFSVKVHFFDRLYDDISLSLLYAAANVMIVPSIQESFGQIASEAMACGTPVVAFNVTSLKDIVDNGINGYIVSPFDTVEMAQRIRDILRQNENDQELTRQNARKKAEAVFDIKKVAIQHLDLYESMLKHDR